MNIKERLLGTAVHTLEVIVAVVLGFGVSFLVKRFGLDLPESLLSVIFVAIAKLIRTDEAKFDYVNDR